jgi:hypothetical protein
MRYRVSLPRFCKCLGDRALGVGRRWPEAPLSVGGGALIRIASKHAALRGLGRLIFVENEIHLQCQ